MSPRVTEERYGVLMEAVERNADELRGHPAEKVALSALHANEWSLADLSDVLLDHADLRAANRKLREALGSMMKEPLSLIVRDQARVALKETA